MHKDALIGDLSLFLYSKLDLRTNGSISFSQYYDSAGHNPLLGE